MIKNLTQFFLFSVALFCILIVVWALNKGFDITDEGFYLLSYQPRNSIGYQTSFYGLIVRKIFGWLGTDWFSIRILRLLLTVLSSGLLGVGIDRMIKKNYDPKHEMSVYATCAFSVLGAMVSYSYGPQSLSYNSLNLIFVQFAGMFTLLSLSINSVKWKNLAIICAGFSCVFILFIKFTTFPLLMLLLAVIILFIEEKEKIKTLAFFFIGVSIGCCILFAVIINPIQFAEIYRTSVRFAVESGGGYDISSQLDAMFELLGTSTCLSLIAIVIVCGIQLLKYVSQNKKTELLARIFGVLLFLTGGACFIAAYGVNREDAGMMLFLTLLSLFYFISERIWNYSEEKNGLKQMIMGILLLLTPITCSVGTNNLLMENMLLYVSFLAASLLIFSIHFDQRIRAALLILFAGASFYSFYNLFVNKPYRILPLIENSVKISEIPEANGLCVDEKTATFLNSIYKSLKENNFREGDTLLGFFKIPGVVYLMKGTLPGGPLWSDKNADQFYLQLRMSKTMLYSPYILLTGSYIDDRHVDSLKHYGVNFPEEYINVKSVENSLLRYVVNVYVPNKKQKK